MKNPIITNQQLEEIKARAEFCRDTFIENYPNAQIPLTAGLDTIMLVDAILQDRIRIGDINDLSLN